MTKLVPFEDPGNYRRVKTRILKLWEDGTVIILPHAADRMRQCKLDTADLWNIIRMGRIVEHSKPRQRWRYVIQGTTVDRKRKGRCVVEINGKLIIITAFEP